MAQPKHDIASLYAPQFEQFGMKLDTDNRVWAASFDNETGCGNAWILPLGSSCLVMEHNVTPREDMLLSEFTPVPYACATRVNQSTLSCMPQSGIMPCNVIAEAREKQASSNICTFVQGSCGESISPLKADTLYHSRSVIFLPNYFDELEERYPSEFAGMFEAFGSSAWNSAATTFIAHALSQLTFSRTGTRGSLLYAQSVIEKMVAELASLTAEGQDTQPSTGRRENARLAQQAAILVEKAVADGKRISIEELATRLYTSKSRLCAAFKEEMGETIASYAKKRLLERAELMLGSSDESISSIASKLGYAHQAAFTQAFKQARGITPSTWRALCDKGSQK